LLLAHPSALDIAQSLGPTVAILVQGRDVLHCLDARRVEIFEEPLVPGPTPDQCDRRGVLRRLVGVTGISVSTKEHRAIWCHLVHDLAAALVDDLRYVAQRPQMILDGSELPSGNRRECRVLTISAEQPG